MDWKKMMYIVYSRKRPSGHMKAMVDLSRLSQRVKIMASKHINVTKARLIHYKHINSWSFTIKRPSCLFFYGDSIECVLTEGSREKEFEMKQGDLLYISSGTVTTKGEKDTDMCLEESIFLFIEGEVS